MRTFALFLLVCLTGTALCNPRANFIRRQLQSSSANSTAREVAAGQHASSAGLAAFTISRDVQAGQHAASSGMATYTASVDVSRAVDAGSHAVDISRAVSAGTHAEQAGSQAAGASDLARQVEVATHAVNASMAAFDATAANNAVPEGWAAAAAAGAQSASNSSSSGSATVRLVTEKNYTLGGAACQFPQIRYFVEDSCLPENGEFVRHSCSGTEKTWSVRELYSSVDTCRGDGDPELFFADTTDCPSAAPSCEDVPAAELVVLQAYRDSACREEPTAMVMRKGCHPFQDVYADVSCESGAATLRFYTDPQCLVFISVESLEGEARAAVLAAEGLPERTSVTVGAECTAVPATASLMLADFTHFELAACAWDAALVDTFAALKAGRPVDPAPSPAPSPAVDVPVDAPEMPISILDDPGN